MTNWPVVIVGVLSILVGASMAVYTTVPWRKRISEELAIWDRLPPGPMKSRLWELIEGDVARYLRSRRRRPFASAVRRFWGPVVGLAYGLLGVFVPGLGIAYLIGAIPVLGIELAFFQSELRTIVNLVRGRRRRQPAPRK